MRFDKFTTKLQEGLAEAQSLALGRDHQYIEPQHLLLALLDQEDGGVAWRCVAKAGGNPNALKKALAAGDRPAAQGRGHAGRGARLARPRPRCSTSPTRKRRSAATSTSRPNCSCSPRRRQGRDGTPAQAGRRQQGRAGEGHRAGARRRQGQRPGRRIAAPGAGKKYTLDLTERARARASSTR